MTRCMQWWKNIFFVGTLGWAVFCLPSSSFHRSKQLSPRAVKALLERKALFNTVPDVSIKQDNASSLSRMLYLWPLENIHSVYWCGNVLVACSGQKIHVIDPEKGVLRQIATEHNLSQAIALESPYRMVAYSKDSRSLLEYDVMLGKLIKTVLLDAGQADFVGLYPSAQKKHIAVVFGQNPCAFAVWCRESDFIAKIKTSRAHVGAPLWCDDNHLCFVQPEARLMHYNAASRKMVYQEFPSAKVLKSLTCAGAAILRLLINATEQESLCVVQPSSNVLTLLMPGIKARSYDWCKSGSCAVIGTAGGELFLYDFVKQYYELIMKSSVPFESILTACSKDGSLVINAAKDGRVVVADVTHKKIINEFSYASPIKSLQFNGSGDSAVVSDGMSVDVYRFSSKNH